MSSILEIRDNSIADNTLKLSWLDYYKSDLYDESYDSSLTYDESVLFFNTLHKLNMTRNLSNSNYLESNYRKLLTQAIDKYDLDKIKILIKKCINIISCNKNSPLLYIVKKIYNLYEEIKIWNNILSRKNYNDNIILNRIQYMQNSLDKLIQIFNLIIEKGGSIYSTDDKGSSVIEYIIPETIIVQKYIKIHNRSIVRTLKNHNKLYSDIIYEISKFL